MMDNIMDDEGRCISHPFVQLQRLSIVTGKWKTLLDCCPLCAMDSKSSSASRNDCSTSSICSGGDDDHEQIISSSMTTTTIPIDDADSSSPVITTSPQTPLHSHRSGGGGGNNVKRSSRVRFQPEKDVQFTTPTATFTNDNLNDLFRQYQHHQDNLQLQSNIKRSMSSSSLPAHFTSSGSSVSSSMSKSALKAQPRYKVCEVRMQKQLDDSEKVTTMSMDLSLSMDDLISSSSSSSRSGEIKKREELIPNNHHVIPLQSELVVLPDPEEFPCYTPQTTVIDDSRRHQVTYHSSSSSSSSSPPHQGWNCRSPYQADGTSMMMMQSLQASPSSKARSLQHSRQQQQQPIYNHNNMIIDPTPDYDDEVSTLNSTGYSVQSPQVPSSTSFSTPIPMAHHADDNASVNPNTNDCDETGRCIHHPHVRLRKKKLFGKGWKVLMSACPDCCVNELHRMRAVAENKARIRERSVGSSTSRSISTGRTSRRSASPHSINNGEEETRRATNPRSRSTSKGSRSGNNISREEGRARSTSRSDSRSSSGRHVNSKEHNHHCHQDQESIRPPLAAAAALPTKHSPSLSSTDRHHQQRQTVVPSAKANTSKFMHRESDETTASLTGSSSGSSNENSPDNSDRTNGSLSAGEVLSSGPNVNITNLRNYDSGSSRIVEKNNSSRHHHRSQQQHERHQEEEEPLPRGTIQVRKMQWTDPKNGQMGSYTGQVNTHFIPHGYGVMEYHDRSRAAKDGRWKEGRYRKSGSSNSSSSSRKGHDGRSSSRSASRSRSKSRDGGRHRARSRSRRPEQ